MKAFGGFLLFAVMVLAAFSYAFANESGTACFDIATDGGNITHIFVASMSEVSASEYFITVGGEVIEHLSTDESPCEDIPSDVWFSLHGKQDEARVCVSAQGADPADSQVYAKVNNEGIIGTQPFVSIERVE